MRLYNFRRNQSAWGSKSDMSHRSRGPKIYQGDKGQGWTQATQLTVNGEETSAPSTTSHRHKNVPACVTEPEWEPLRESRTQARTRVYRAEKELGAELLTRALVKKHTRLQLQGRRSHKTALTISSQTKIREPMRLSNGETLHNRRIHTGRRKDARAIREGLHKMYFFLNPQRDKKDLHAQSEKRFQ